MAPPESVGGAPKTRREPNDAHGYKWEDNPALRHGCAICQTCLNNPRAKKTCYGKHAEPCIRYHQTMFRIDRSHTCDACNNSNEQHHKRHREIAVLLKRIQEIDDAEGAAAPTSKAARKSLCSEAPAADKGEMEGDKENVRINEESSENGSKAKQIRLQKLAARNAKAATKVLERQAQAHSTTVTAGLVKDISIAIHEHPIMIGTPNREEFNAALRSEIQALERLQQDAVDDNVKQKKAARTAHREKQVEQAKNILQSKYVVNIINKLGINPLIDDRSKERKTLVEQLGNAIRADIETVANEAKETMKRQTAYWKYANKKMYNTMVRSKELINWETGEKLQELELEDNEREDGEVS
ncbi:hypothetical protein M432DRAFT_636784 [Thermoascus aurantiacus ATCC 26904]